MTPVATTKSGTRRRRKLGGRSTSPSALLRPDSLLPALVGRDEELARLEQWCLRDDDFDIRLVTGAAGQGKSRLARELMQLVKANNWHVEPLSLAVNGEETVLQLPTRPSLLVLDYAETRSEQLFHVLTALLEHGVHDKVRFLLLARTATDWWNALLARDSEVADLVADITVQPIAPLTRSRERVNELYSTACQQFAMETGSPPVLNTSAPYKSYSSVLDVLADALTTVISSGPNTKPGTDRLLAHERRYIAASAAAAGIDELDDVDLNRICAALTFYGAATEIDATQLISECSPDLSPVVTRKVGRLFRRLYPGAQTYIDGLRPDALAEDLIAGVLIDDGRLPGSADGPESAARNTDQRHRALLTLSRAATRYPEVARELEHVVANGDRVLYLIAIEVASQLETPDQLTSALKKEAAGRSAEELAILLGRIPDETVALSDLAAQLARQIIEEIPDSGTPTLQDITTAMECSNRFSDAGWVDQAAQSAQLAVERLRLFAPTTETESALGRALCNLSNRLWERGELARSLRPADEAIQHLVDANAQPVVLAGARSNLAFRLAELDRYDEALAEVRAAQLHLAGHENDTDAQVAKTRGSILNNMSCILLSSGRADAARTYAAECVKLRRSQALQNRDRFLPFVARALANAAPSSEITGDPEHADRLITEARALHRLTGIRAPIFRFEESESATLSALIAMSRTDWESAMLLVDEARSLLDSVVTDLGELSNRLSHSLCGIRTAVEERETLSLLEIAQGKHPDISLPLLLEYRDL